MFIKLQQFSGYLKARKPTQPVWVNPDHITYLSSSTRPVYRYDLEAINGVTKKEDITLTTISFVAGLREESDSVSVMESPQEIMQLILGKERGA